jgi:biotin carboxylase
VSTVQGFRDKEIMKQRVAAAGLRVPRSARIHTREQAWAVAEQIGFPLILKPIAGAGSADTHRCDEPRDLDAALDRLGHVPEASCEEFVDGEEFTFDTVCIEGRPAFMNVCQYIPRPLVARTNEWISPQQITIRNLDQPALRAGIELGLGVLDALGMGTGFTHMEWYRKRDGEVVFGEIACRPGGGHLVDQMNLTCDIDLFREWARAACWHAFEASTHRKYNVACIFKRARGQGRIRQVQGLEAYRRQFGPGICWENLLPVGTPRRDWRQTLVSDGFVMVRHPDWTEVRRMADAAATGIQLWAE